jgi:hypothetical protein
MYATLRCQMLAILIIPRTQVKYGKVQSMCVHYQRSSCRRANCRYDHDLIDAQRIEHLVRWATQGTSNYEFMTVECRVTGGHILWKIILKPEAFAKLSPTDHIAHTIPPRPFCYENEDLLKAIRHMERIVGVTVGDRFVKGKSSCLTLHIGVLISSRLDE